MIFYKRDHGVSGAIVTLSEDNVCFQRCPDRQFLLIKNSMKNFNNFNAINFNNILKYLVNNNHNKIFKKNRK